MSREGKVEAIVVDATQGTPGRFVYPYRAGGFDATANAYRLPYELAQINDLKPFDYSAVGIAEPQPPAVGATGGAGVEREGAGSQERPPRQAKG